MTLEQELEAGLAQLGLELSAEQIDRLNQYLALLNKWNKTYNLTAVRETERMVAYHVLDSLSALPHIQGVRVLDVGSGGGMPGMLFAIARPDWQLTLIDANHKKTTFLRQAAIELGLNNVEVHCERVEALAAPAFDVITSRAFASLADFTEWSAPALAEGAVWLAMKGKRPDDEIAALPPGVEVFHVEQLQVPGLGAERCLLWLRTKT